MPHKVAIIALADRVSVTARIAGAANALRLGIDGQLEAEMVDGEGFVWGVQAKGQRLDGIGALVVGAGGVGSAIVASVARLALFDPKSVSYPGPGAAAAGGLSRAAGGNRQQGSGGVRAGRQRLAPGDEPG